MTRIIATFPEVNIDIDVCSQEMEDLVCNTLDNTDLSGHIETCLESFDFDPHIDECLERHNFQEYKEHGEDVARKCEVLRADQEYLIQAVGDIRNVLDRTLAAIRPLNNHQLRALRIQEMVLEMSESDAQSCLEYCRAALQMTRSDNQ